MDHFLKIYLPEYKENFRAGSVAKVSSFFKIEPVIDKTDNSLICKIINGGILKSKKGMNLPGMKLSTDAISKKDIRDMEFAFQHRVDYVALSFVRSFAFWRHQRTMPFRKILVQQSLMLRRVFITGL